MALRDCPHCGNKISDKADVCPKCRHKLSDKELNPTDSKSKGTGDSNHEESTKHLNYEESTRQLDNGYKTIHKTPEKKISKKSNGRSLIILICVGVIAALCVIGAIFNHRNQQHLKEMEAVKAQLDSISRADSLAKEQAELMAAEQAAEESRRDSIRRDSIALEEKMKLGQLSFISHDGNWMKILPKFGFKLTSKKLYTEPSDYDEDVTWENTAYVYKRNLYGREVTFKFVRTYQRGPEYEGGFGRDYWATMIIHDKNEKEKFIQDIKNLNKNDIDMEGGYYGYIYRAPNIDHYIGYHNGEFIFDTDH